MPNGNNTTFTKLELKTYTKLTKITLFDLRLVCRSVFQVAVNYIFAENFNLFRVNAQFYLDAQICSKLTIKAPERRQ